MIEQFHEAVLQRMVELAEEAADYSSALTQLILKLSSRLEEQPPIRQTLVLGVLAIAFEAFDEDHNDAGLFLLQVALIMATAHEDTAQKRLLEVVRLAKAELDLPRN